MRLAEKRRGDRLLCAGLVELRWVDPDGTKCKAIANLDDLSPGGVSLFLDRPVPQGARVQFTYARQAVAGDVRHCTRTDIGWTVGVRFGSGTQWDPGANPPEHLLDPDSVPEDARLRVGPLISSETRSTISCLILNQAVRREEKE